MIREFLQKLNDLQDTYGIYIEADYDEDWDYDINDEYICHGINPRVAFVNKGGYEIQDIYRGEDFHYCICDKIIV